MQYKAFAALFFAATALAAPATDSSSDDYSDLYDTSSGDDSFDLDDVPTSILAVLATAIPDSFYNDLMDDSSRSSIVSAAAAGTYPAWYNSLPSSVKAWATSNFDDEIAGASSTIDSFSTQTGSASNSVTATGSSTAVETGSSSASSSSDASSAAGVTTTSGQTSSAAQSTSSSDSSSDSSSSASASASPTESTGGAPAATGGVAMGVAGAAGMLALALAL